MSYTSIIAGIAGIVCLVSVILIIVIFQKLKKNNTESKEQQNTLIETVEELKCRTEKLETSKTEEIKKLNRQVTELEESKKTLTEEVESLKSYIAELESKKEEVESLKSYITKLERHKSEYGILALLGSLINSLDQINASKDSPDLKSVRYNEAINSFFVTLPEIYDQNHDNAVLYINEIFVTFTSDDQNYFIELTKDTVKEVKQKLKDKDKDEIALLAMTQKLRSLLPAFCIKSLY